MVANLTTRLGQLTSSPAGGPYTGANKIINGDMVIDQRNAGASVSLGNGSYYITDRWAARLNTTVGGPATMTGQQVADAPSGFYYSLKFTGSGSVATPAANDYTMAWQGIEGLNCTDLNFGTANAKSVTLSFWVKSSLTGNFGVSIRNVAGSGSTYMVSYNIPVANTWTLITATIVGDTSGTWPTDNSAWAYVYFDLGVGTTYSIAASAGTWTNGSAPFGLTGGVKLIANAAATLQITGVKLEVGSIATPFVPDNYSDSLVKCQRYYCKTFPQATAPATNLNASSGCLMIGSLNLANAGMLMWLFPVTMRANPTITRYGIKSANTNWTNFTNSNVATTSGANVISEQSTCVYSNGDGTAAAVNNQVGIHAAADAEL